MQNDTLTMIKSVGETSKGLTLSVAAILASPTVLPGSDLARLITVTAGRNVLESSENSGPLGLLTKMLLDQSVTWCSTKRFLIWKVSATPAGRTIFQLSPLAPITKGSAFSLLPTPMFKDGDSHYILTRQSSLNRVGKQLHWGHKAMLFYNLKKGKVNPRFSLFLMGYPTTFLDLAPSETQLRLQYQ